MNLFSQRQGELAEERETLQLALLETEAALTLARDEAQEFGSWMESVLHVPIEYNRVSPVIGCHVGPTVLGPVVVMEEKPEPPKGHAG